MDEGTRQTEEERMKETARLVVEKERALLEMVVLRVPKSQLENETSVVIEVDALETCLRELLDARQRWFLMNFIHIADLQEKIDKIEPTLLTQFINQRSGELLKAILGESKSNYAIFVIDNMLIDMLWQSVVTLLRSSKDVETMRTTMTGFVPFMQKLKDIIEAKEREPETAKGIVESFWADLVKRGVVG